MQIASLKSNCSLSLSACMCPAKFVMEIWKGAFVMRIKVFHQRCLNLATYELARNQTSYPVLKRSALYKDHQKKLCYLTTWPL